jgi:integrase/recombinase XerD
VYSFARISAVVGMKVEDFYQMGHRRFIRLLEKGGKAHEVPAHHQITEALVAYMEAAAISPEGNRRTDALRMIYRRSTASGIAGDVCCHTIRATGITVYLQNGSSLEIAQQIAAHESRPHHQTLRPHLGLGGLGCRMPRSARLPH